MNLPSAPVTAIPAQTVTKRQGRAWGAITILNATATGVGCSLAIDAITTATFDLPRQPVGPAASPLPSSPQSASPFQPAYPLPSHSSPPTASLLACLARRLDVLLPEDLQISCPFPESRGLKTSSSVAAAAGRALAPGIGEPELEQACVDASLECGVSITGAFDDQVAVQRGGCHLTDNLARVVLARLGVAAWHVAIWLPMHGIPKSTLRGLDTSSLRPAARAAQKRAEGGDLPGALSANGAAYLTFYQRHGLPVDGLAAQVALQHGALGAGLSGTGPAIAAIFGQPTQLPQVPGGSWSWHKVVP